MSLCKVRFRFGIEVAYLGDDLTPWDKIIFEHRQVTTPRLLVQIQFEDGHKSKVFLHELTLVQEKGET